MNISRSVADLLDNTGSLNGFALSFIWGQRAQCLGQCSWPSSQGVPCAHPQTKWADFPQDLTVPARVPT